jgi:SulP family sulfate permease
LLDKWSIKLVKRLKGEDLQGLGSIPFDLMIIAAVIGVAIIFGFLTAVLIGLVFAFLEFVYLMSTSPIRRSFRASSAGLHLMRDERSGYLLQKYGDAIVTLELDGALFFGSAGRVEQEVESLDAQGVRYVVLDFKRIRNIDSTGALTINRLYRKLNKKGKTLCLSYVQQERRKSRAQARDTDRRQHSQGRQNRPRGYRRFGQ